MHGTQSKRRCEKQTTQIRSLSEIDSSNGESTTCASGATKTRPNDKAAPRVWTGTESDPLGQPEQSADRATGVRRKTASHDLTPVTRFPKEGSPVSAAALGPGAPAKPANEV